MNSQWTFGRKLGAGFALIVMLAVATGGVAVYALRSAVDSKDHVITVEVPLAIEAESLRGALERKIGALRGYLLTQNERYLERARDARQQFLASLKTLAGRPGSEPVARLEAEYEQAMEAVLALRRTSATTDTVTKAFEDQVVPKRDQVDQAIREFLATERRALEAARAESTAAASTAATLVVAIAIAVVVLGVILAFVLARTLSRQIASVVGQVQSSSAELQAAANQQATGAKEQAAAMAEITTTISELLATSRQIAESAQRVAQIASQTASSARTGDTTVDIANTSIGGIKRQVDLVVAHMVDLGKKSQEIGAVLDLVSELAEQTNILAINASIEAAGAGEAGKRFGVVADEIRKLADRVGASAKEIRSLIEDVRGAVNTTVMATETGSKSVDAGSAQFAHVATAFKQIAGLVATTTEAAREIELSTKQQSTAVEQVNVAIANVAQATRETEASSSQTLTTASQLATLSGELLRLVQPQARVR